MKILVFGASGQTGRMLTSNLIADGHHVIAALRNPEQASAFEQACAEVRMTDLEQPIGTICDGVECVVFTAGSGSATGKDKTLTVDLWGAVQCIRASEAAGVARFVMISALKAADPNRGSDALKPYLVAKHAADEILKQSKLTYSILRPGRLTDGPATGHVQATPENEPVDYQGSISRADVAAFVCQHIPHAQGNVVLDLIE